MRYVERCKLWHAKVLAERHLKAVAQAKGERGQSKALLQFHKDRYHRAVTTIHRLEPDNQLPLWII